MLTALLLRCSNKHEVGIVAYHRENIPQPGVVACIEQGRVTGDMEDVCPICKQRASYMEVVDTSIPTFAEMPQTKELSEDARRNLEKPNACLILIRKPNGNVSVSTLIVHIIEGRPKAN